MIVTKSFCYCMPLRLGCIVIAWIQVFPLVNFMQGTMQTWFYGWSTLFGGSHMFVTIANITLGCCLMFGVYKDNKKAVYYYLFGQAVVTVLRVLLLIIFAIKYSLWHDDLIFSAVIVFIVQVYFLVVVYSYHGEMNGT